MYTQLTDELYLRRVTIPVNQKVVQERTPVNRIDVKDISGSTDSFAERMGIDECNRIDQMPDGDFYTLAVFSSPGGDYRVVVKGTEINAATRPIIKQIIMDNSHATNMTCFSEVLTELATIIPDLSRFSRKFALTFLTDGYPVPNTQAEQKAIEQAIKAIAGQLSSVLLVGYGDYYNKALMADMAQWFGGMLMHSSALHQYSVIMQDFLVSSSVSAPRVEMGVPPGAFAAFTVGSSGVTAYDVSDKVRVSLDNEFVYFITNQMDPASQLDDPSQMLDGVYGAALLMSQRLRADLAIQILGKIGDKFLVEKLGSSFTNAEFGASENLIQSATHNESTRFIAGRVPGCAPDPDALCLVDLLEELASNPEVKFYPQHPSFHYNPIGRSPKDGVLFIADNVGHPLASLVWNSSRLNLSTRTRITGSVQLNDEHEKFGFAKLFPTFRWKTYAVIADGKLNITVLPLAIPQGLKDRFGINGQDADGISVLHLESFPIINRAIVEQMPNATELCKLAWAELELSAQAKVYRTLIDELKGDEKEPLSEIFSPEQDAYLRSHGITKNGFSPTGTPVPATDVYEAVQFEIKIAGYSSLPSLNEVRKRMADQKEPTKAGALMLPHYEDYMKSLPVEDVDLPWLERELAAIVSEQRKISGKIQRAKFAVVLGGRWFPEFSTRADSKINVDGQDFEFEIKTIQVKI